LADGPNEHGAVHSLGKSGESRSQRSRKSRRSGKASLSAILHVSHQHLTKVVLAVFALTLLAAAAKFWSERTYYPQILLGATPAEVRYGFGSPQKVGKNGAFETWAYIVPGHDEFVYFDNGVATKVGCVSNGGNCPGILGIEGGAFEDELIARLGKASQQYINDGEKIILYQDLSLSFKLNKFKIIDIFIDRSNKLSFSAIYRFIVFLMP
jgi:hypothetical protein